MSFLGDYANGVKRADQHERTRQEIINRVKKDIKFRIFMKKNVLHFIRAIEQSIEDGKLDQYQRQEIALEIEAEKTEELNFLKRVMRLV